MEELPDFTLKTQTVPLKQIQTQPLLCYITFSLQLLQLPTLQVCGQQSIPLMALLPRASQ